MNSGLIKTAALVIAVIAALMILVPGAPTPAELIPSWTDIQGRFEH